MLIAALALATLTGCATTPTSPAQQVATDPRNGDGLGGTGISGNRLARNGARNGDGLGGTGIVGTISGFGSIIVNGLELQFDHTTSVGSDGQPAALEELRVGQVVEGIAKRRDGRLTLDSIDIQHAVAGPITGIDYKTETMTVLGQTVRLNLAGDKVATKAFRSLRAGDMVRVSGIRTSDGTIVASRVDQQNDDDRVIVRGNAAAVTGDHVRVGALDVPLRPGVAVSAPSAGGRVFASGRMINGAFEPDVITAGTGLPFSAPVTDVSLEGYVPKNTAPLTIDGMAVNGAHLPADAGPDDRIVVTGRVVAPDRIDATALTKVHTVVTIMKAHGTRPSALRPDMERPERVAPDRPDIQRPEITRPDIQRPEIERPQGITGV